MKDVIVCTRSPLSGEQWAALHFVHKRFVEAYFASVPPTHPDRLAKQVLQLHALYTGRASGVPFERKDLLEARSHFYLPLEIPRVWIALAELAPYLEVSQRVSILDLGAGMGTAAIGAVLFFAAQGTMREIQITSVDHDRTLTPSSQLILEAARRATGLLIEESRQVLPVDRYLKQFSSDRFDLVLASNLLGEAFPADEATEETVLFLSRLLKEKVKKTGFVVVTEPSLKRSSRLLSQALGELQAIGFPTFSPCTTGGTCPYLATKEKYCIHSQPVTPFPVTQSVASRAQFRSHEVHFSYAVLSPRGLSKPMWPEAAPDGQTPGRVISFPDRRPHGFAYQLCTPDGIAQGVAQRLLPDDATKGNRILHGTQVLVAKEWSPT